MDKCFVVDFEAAGDRQRTDALLDFPALRQKDEAFGEIRSFDNFYNPSACCLDRLDEAFLVTPIDDNGLDPGAEFHKPSHQWYAASLILDVGASNSHREETSIGVDSDVTLAANHFLGSIVAPFTLRRVAFDGLSIDDDKGWIGLST